MVQVDYLQLVQIILLGINNLEHSQQRTGRHLFQIQDYLLLGLQMKLLQHKMQLPDFIHSRTFHGR